MEPGMGASQSIRTMVPVTRGEAEGLGQLLFDQFSGFRLCMARTLGDWGCSGDDQL